MPISYRIDPDARLVRTVATGVLTDAELLEHKEQLAADPAFEAGMHQISDVRGVERLEVSAVGVRSFVSNDDRHAARFAGHRMAIVANSDVVFGMARMYQTMSRVKVGVFRDMHEALAFVRESGA